MHAIYKDSSLFPNGKSEENKRYYVNSIKLEWKGSTMCHSIVWSPGDPTMECVPSIQACFEQLNAFGKTLASTKFCNLVKHATHIRELGLCVRYKVFPV